jgi:hypothetical protein
MIKGFKVPSLSVEVYQKNFVRGFFRGLLVIFAKMKNFGDSFLGWECN